MTRGLTKGLLVQWEDGSWSIEEKPDIQAGNFRKAMVVDKIASMWEDHDKIEDYHAALERAMVDESCHCDKEGITPSEVSVCLGDPEMCLCAQADRLLVEDYDKAVPEHLLDEEE